jgi:hypothetical protein
MNYDAITIRRSTEGDRKALLRLAELDEAPRPAGEALLAFVGGELRAALPLERGSAVADPFHLTGDVIDLLRLRARQEIERAA